MEGQSPFSGWPLPPGSESTFLFDQPRSYTTLYVRRVFDGVDPATISRLIVAVEAEDGLAVYLNGHEIGRSNGGKPGTALLPRAGEPC